jgi:hypothetical protein
MSDRLERMRRNPAGDWTIQDVEAVCREHAVICEAARGGGSHYIRKLVAFIDAMRKQQ